MLEARSAVTQALIVACPVCEALIGDPCKRSDGQLVALKGHLGVHGQRLAAARVRLGVLPVRTLE